MLEVILENLIQIVAGVVTIIILPIAGIKAKRRFLPKQEPAQVQRKTAGLASGIVPKVREFRAKYKASRVYVSGLHNGSKLKIDGLHYEKLSVIYEAVDAVTAPTYGVVRDYPILQFSPIIHELATRGRVHRSMHEEPLGSESRIQLEMHSIHDEYILPITNKNDVVVGLVGVTYHNGRHEWSEEQWHDLSRLTEYVEDTLNAISRESGSPSGVIDWK